MQDKTVTIEPLSRFSLADITDVAHLWRQAWLDTHAQHVPQALMSARGPEHFVDFALTHRDDALVSVTHDRVPSGLVIVDPVGAEVVQLAVDAQFRGQGHADVLLQAAEDRLSPSHETAWLAVLASNDRARTFYTRRRWRDHGTVLHQAPAGDGTVPVQVHRYVKTLDRTAHPATGALR